MTPGEATVTRPDLCIEPHGWRMPRAVRVTVQREVAP